jgi:hypothetical protein
MSASAPVVVELAGPAGSGKSSLVRHLVGPGAAGYTQGALRGRIGRTGIARGALRVALPFAAQAARMPSRPLYRFRIMVQLECHLALLRRWRGVREVVVLDQGPVYLLSILQRALRGDGRDSRAFVRYWEDTVSRWSRTIDLVVVLDAPDAVLHERVQRRGSPHPLLGRSLAQAAGPLAEGRQSRDSVLAALRACNPSLATVELHAGELPLEALAERVREQAERLRRGLAADAPASRTSGVPRTDK